MPNNGDESAILFSLQILDSIPKDTKNRVWILLNFKEYGIILLRYLLYMPMLTILDCISCRGANILNGKTRMRACVIQVQADQEIDIPHPKDPSSRLSGNAAVVLCQAIGCCGIIDPRIFHSSSPDVFKSCTSTSAVEAFVKARQGHLFPLQRGICFLESVRELYFHFVISRYIIIPCISSVAGNIHSRGSNSLGGLCKSRGGFINV